MPIRPCFFIILTLALSPKAHSQGCITLQGALTGSSVCLGAFPALTFTASNGTGPFTLIYSNGTSNYIQHNVQSGVPFISADIPLSNTIYTLTSIQDASGCPPVNVSGITTGSNLIVNGDFNNGATGFTSDYTYSASGLPPAVYTVGPDPVAWNPGMTPCHDHTSGLGNMMLVNGSQDPNVKVWSQTVPVTPNTNYQFSTWLETITTINPARLQFSINGVTIGNIFQANSSSCVWDEFYTTWNSGSSTTATISILNMNQDFSGNDFSLDDINFAKITTLDNSALVTVQHCATTLCSGSLGDPIVNITFGSGSNPGQPLSNVVPGASTTLQYVSVTGNPALPTPVDGQYTITNNVPVNGAWFAGAVDHTPNDVNGYMAFYNSSEQPGEFYSQTINNLCGGTTYQFAAWIANALNPAVLVGVTPDITFLIEQTDGTILASYDTGPITQNAAFTWIQYGLFFTTPSNGSAVILKMINNSPGGTAQPGNDFAIDDITFRACGPTSVSSFASATAVDSTGVCEGTTGISLYGTLSAGYTTPNYLWQISSDNGVTWTDIPNSNTLQLSVSPPVTGLQKKYKYRMQSGDGAKINSVNCRVVSNELILSVTPLPTGDFSFVQDVCNPAQVDFTGISQPGVTYTWNMDGSDHSPATPGSSSFVYIFNPFGTYPVTMNISGSGCLNSVTKTIAVLLEPADIISTPDTTICVGTGAVLRTHPSIEFCWTPALYLDNPSSATPVASPPVATKYYFTAKVTGANLIVNGDFETGNTGFTSQYQYSNSGYPEAVYLVGKSPHDWNMNNPVNCGDHTTGSGNMMIVNGGTVSNVIIWAERISVTPNTNYAFSTWVQSVYPVAPAILQFSINGTPLGSAITASSNTCQWNQFYTTWNSGNNTTATISLINQNTASFGNDFALDDISFAQLTVQIDSVTIAVETPSVHATPVPDTTVCPGMPVPLHAIGSMNYAWSPAASLSDASIADPVAYPLATTGYTVTGTSARGCVATDDITINIYPRLLSIAPDTTICLGDAAQLYASGGNPYSWSPAGFLDDPTIASPVAHTNANTRFYVTASDINQCLETDSVLVSIRPVPLFQQPPNETVCLGDSVILESANLPGYIYSWAPARGLNDPSAPFPAASPGTPTVYTLNIRDSVCSTYKDQFFVSVIVRPLPIISIEKTNDINCSMPTARLTAAGGISYTWTPASGLSDPLAASPLASIDSTTTFIVKGLGADGCSALDTVTLAVSATGDNTFVVPNAFTPNGDGHNDCFGIRRWGDVQLEEFSVYNRWGLQVFTTRNPSDCWDGRYRGKLQETGGYAYVIRAHSFCGEITHTGVVMLIR